MAYKGPRFTAVCIIPWKSRFFAAQVWRGIRDRLSPVLPSPAVQQGAATICLCPTSAPATQILYNYDPKFVTCPRAPWTEPISCDCHGKIWAPNMFYDKCLPEPPKSQADCHFNPHFEPKAKFVSCHKGIRTSELVNVLGHKKSGRT